MSEQDSKPFYICFVTTVNAVTTQTLLATIANKLFNPQQTIKFNELHLMISTQGGSVEHGILIYNFLIGLPIKVITYNIGQINSIGNVIFLAGEERYSCAVSSFMFHGVGFDISQQRLELKNINERADHLKNDQDLISSIISARTTITTGDIDAMFLNQTFLNIEEAKERNIFHAIKDIKIPRDADFTQLAFNG